MRRPNAALVGATAALFVVQGLISKGMYPTWVARYSAHNVGFQEGLNVDQLLASVGGLRQMVAGILWVRSDQYFHSGQFDAILPLIRLVTWLDPRQMEVYATGSWHIAYNFTDEQNRSDRRYVPLALALLSEGVEHNQSSFRLFHETGWIYYHKVNDEFDKAVFWFEQSVQKEDVPPSLKAILANAYLRDGRLDDALNLYWMLQRDASAEYARTKDEPTRIRRDTQENNLNNLIMRMVSRGIFGRRDGVYDLLVPGTEKWLYPYDTHDPVDLNFSVKIEVIDKKVLRLTGNWGIATTGARIRIVVRDEEYNILWEPAPEGLDFDVDRDDTFMQDSLYTQNKFFDRKIDMSRNPTMYPFKSERYIVEFFFSPRSAPHHIQDKTGWDGEGMTDSRYIRTDIRPGVRVLFAEYELTRDMVLRRGDYIDSAVQMSPGYVEPETSDVVGVIIRRSLRN
ncbi:MAG: hypothetical protein IH851_00045 [Armatimonadetes bacterium]|nr:hypothetical protein [Armatimonadota bacterium]